MKIAIIGHGYVGKSINRIFEDALVYDPPAGVKTTKDEVNACDFAIVCVPTPVGKDGWSADTSIVESVFEWLRVPLALIKSTVPPGTTEKIQVGYQYGGVCFSPEYVGEGKYFTPPWMYPDPINTITHGFMTIGGKPQYTQQVYDIFIAKMGVHSKIYQTDATTAEAVKYFSNVWGACKVVWANEMFNCMKALGLDYRTVRQFALNDSRIEPIHTAVFPNNRGYGGKCFPKDVRAFVSAVKKAGYNPTLIEKVVELNNKIRKENGQEEV